ncbi:hypothetical protein CRUP_036220, partial [Coryphaenoides rupestris]
MVACSSTGTCAYTSNDPTEDKIWTSYTEYDGLIPAGTVCPPPGRPAPPPGRSGPCWDRLPLLLGRSDSRRDGLTPAEMICPPARMVCPSCRDGLTSAGTVCPPPGRSDPPPGRSAPPPGRSGPCWDRLPLLPGRSDSRRDGLTPPGTVCPSCQDSLTPRRDGLPAAGTVCPSCRDGLTPAGLYNFLEQAFDKLTEVGFHMVACSSTGTCAYTSNDRGQDLDQLHR